MIKHQNETNSIAEWKYQNQWFLAHHIQISIKMLLLIKKRKLILKSLHNSASFFFIILLQITLILAFIHLCPTLVFCFGSKMEILMGSMTEISVTVHTPFETLSAILLQSFSHNLPI